jgi:hypothetical protein
MGSIDNIVFSVSLDVGDIFDVQISFESCFGVEADLNSVEERAVGEMSDYLFAFGALVCDRGFFFVSSYWSA